LVFVFALGSFVFVEVVLYRGENFGECANTKIYAS